MVPENISAALLSLTAIVGTVAACAVIVIIAFKAIRSFKDSAFMDGYGGDSSICSGHPGDFMEKRRGSPRRVWMGGEFAGYESKDGQDLYSSKRKAKVAARSGSASRRGGFGGR